MNCSYMHNKFLLNTIFDLVGLILLFLDFWQFLVSGKKVKVTQSCLTLCNLMDCSLPGSSVHGILQARVLEWVAISFSRGSSRPRDRTQVSCIAGRFFTNWANREARGRTQRSPYPSPSNSEVGEQIRCCIHWTIIHWTLWAHWFFNNHGVHG